MNMYRWSLPLVSLRGKEFLVKHAQISTDALVAFLTDVDLFKSFDTQARIALVSELRWVWLDTDASLFQQGAVGDSMYVLVAGRLAVTFMSSEGYHTTIDELAPGATVGELALLTGMARGATISALEPSMLVQLERSGFDQLARTSPEVIRQFGQAMLPRFHRTELVNVLTRLLGTLDHGALQTIQHQLEWLHLSNGELLFRAGDPSDAYFIVVNGRLSVVAETPHDTAVVVGEISRGETVGEEGLLTGKLRTVSVIATRKTDVVRLSRESFERLLDDFPASRLTIMRRIVERMMPTSDTAHHQGNTVTSIALVAAGHDVPLDRVAVEIVRTLGAYGTTLHLSAERLNQLLQKDGAAQTADDDPSSIALNSWLSEQERIHRYVVYVAEASWSAWTQRCIQQADRILIVGDADHDPTPATLERAIDQLQVTGRRELILLQSAQRQWPTGTDAWLAARTVSAHHHVRLDNRDDFARMVRRLTGRAICIVLGGGGARGLAHVGVLRAIEEAGIPIDMIGGSSMGAIIGGLYAMGVPANEIAKSAITLGAGRMTLDYTLPLVSFFASRKITTALERQFGNLNIEDLWRPFFCTSTNLTQARPVVHKHGRLSLYLRAGSALPALFTPVVDDGELLGDGGIMNNLPVDVMKQISQGGPVIAVNVTLENDLGSGFSFGTSLSGWRVLWSLVWPFSVPIKAPSIFATLLRAMEINEVHQRRTRRTLADLLILPRVQQFGTLEFKAHRQIIQMGYEAGRTAVAEWLTTRRSNGQALSNMEGSDSLNEAT